MFKQSDANVIAVVDEIRELLPQIQKWLPPGVKLSILSDRTQTIRASVHDVQFTLVLTIALVIVVMAIFLRRFWPTFIAGVTVPLSLAGTFAIMWLCGFSLDNISLMALTVAVGFLVDDAIVVIENIVRHIEQGENPVRGHIDRCEADRIYGHFHKPLACGGLYSDSLDGRIDRTLFREFAITLSAAILVSAVVSLTLTPTLCGQFLRASPKDEGQGSRFAKWLQDGYARALRWVLRHRFFTQMLTAGNLGCLPYGSTGSPPKASFPSRIPA